MDELHPTGRQLAAARTLAGLTQAAVAASARISVPTLKRMEASEGPAAGMANNVDAVRRALEAAGVEFRNGSVRLKDGKDLERILALHPDIEKQFAAKRRFWISYAPRPAIQEYERILSEHFGTRLLVWEIPPNFEFVFYDPDDKGNNRESLQEIADQRASRF